MDYYKEIILGDEARKLIKAGINDLAEAVLVTMGPEGKTVIIPDENGFPKVTKDGVSVAKAVAFRDPIKNIGALLVKEVANKTVREAGDGTTTSICLANAFINKGFELLDNGTSYNVIKEQLEDLEKLVVKNLIDSTNPIKDGDIFKVANISVNNDTALANLITEAFSHTEVVKVEKGHDPFHTVEKIKGMELNTGILNNAFINDGASGAIVYDNARLLVVEGHLTNLKSIANSIRSLEADEPLIIITDEVSDQVLRVLKDNYNKGALTVGLIKSPGHAQHRANLLEDIKTACIPKGETMGYIKSIKATNSKTVIEFTKNKESIKKLKDLKALKLITHEDYSKELLTQRINLLEGNMAVIRIGGESPLEVSEIYDRVEDGVLATKCAIDEGVVEGAGVTLFRMVFHIDNLFNNCLFEPYKTIFRDKAIEGIIKHDLDRDFTKEGIIDPVKVTRCAVVNAISVAKTVLGMEAIVQ